MKVVTVILLITICALSAFAIAPGIITYQGRLLNASGTPVPDGDYNVTFRFYNSTGTAKYTEQMAVQTVDGLFTALLGASHEIEASLFDDTAVYLGVQLEGQPEMTPQIRMSSAMYALQAQTVEGKYLGTERVEMKPYSKKMALLALRDSLSSPKITLVQGHLATEMMMFRPDRSVQALEIFITPDENSLSLYNPAPGRTVYFNADMVGNDATRLPDSSVSALECWNEPGLAANDNVTTVVLGTSVSDIVTVTLNAPSNGYVLVTGKGTAFLSGTTGTNYGYAQIDTASGGTVDAPYRVAFGSDDSYTSANQYIPISASRVFSVSSGNYTFRLEGRTSASQGAGASLDVRNSMIQAIFMPTSYGTVNTMVAASEAGQFEAKEAIQVDGTTMYRVDLRELELRASRAEADAERARAEAEMARRELMEAKLEAATQGME